MPVRELALLLALGGGIPPPSPQDDVVIRTTTSLVEVRVVAEDSHGKPVADLNQSDFQILDNSQPQTIRLFAAYRSGPTGSPATPAVASSPTPADYAIILLDWMNTSYRNRIFVKEQVLKLLKTYEPRQRLAVFVLSRDNPRLLCDFTYDRELLSSLVERLSEDPEDMNHGGGGGAALASPAGQGGRGGRGNGAPIARENAILEASKRTTDTAVTLEKMADHLVHIPGRKALLWVSSGIPMTIDGIYYAPYLEGALGRLNKSDTAVYTIEAAGLQIVNHTSDSQFEFARRTGGLAYCDSNDLTQLMRSALEDMSVSYTLGFHAPESGRPGLHAIDVKVNRPNVKLRYRESYDPAATVH